MKWRALAAGMSVAASLCLALPASAAPNPDVLRHGQHGCSHTNPEYMASDDNMAVTLRHGTTAFTSYGPADGRTWGGVYWITGYHNENSSICNNRRLPGKRILYGESLSLPVQLGKAPLITTDLQMYDVSGRPGYDLWFAADRRETGPRKMQRDPRTWEVMVQPGHGGTFHIGNPGWHRIFVAILPDRNGFVNVHALDLTRLARSLGIPRSDWWMTIGAGGEGSGGFTVYSYSLHIAGQHPRPRPYHKRHPKPRHHRIVRHKRPHPKPRPRKPVHRPIRALCTYNTTRTGGVIRGVYFCTRQR